MIARRGQKGGNQVWFCDSPNVYKMSLRPSQLHETQPDK